MISYLIIISDDLIIKNDDSTNEKNDFVYIDQDIIFLEFPSNKDFIEEKFIQKFEIIIMNIIFNLYKLFEKDLNSPGSYKEEEIDSFKKSKNHLSLKLIAERTIIFSSFKISYNNYLALFEVAKYHSDNLLCAKAKEGIASAFILYDLFKTYKKDLKKFSSKELVFSEEIETIIDNSLNFYKKTKIIELYIDALFKFVFYYMFFENKLKNLLDYEKKIIEELNNFNNLEYKIFCYLKLKYVFDFIKFRRKSIYYVYLV